MAGEVSDVHSLDELLRALDRDNPDEAEPILDGLAGKLPLSGLLPCESGWKPSTSAVPRQSLAHSSHARSSILWNRPNEERSNAP